MSSRPIILFSLMAVLAPAGAGAAVVQRCYTAQLRVTPGRVGVAAGSIGETVSFRNVGSRTCTLSGYPGLQLRNGAGHELATHLHRGASVTVTARPVRVVTLSPGHNALFDIGYADATGYGNERCPSSARVEVTPPNDFKALTIRWRLQPYGGTTEHLICGLISVSPVYAG